MKFQRFFLVPMQLVQQMQNSKRRIIKSLTSLKSLQRQNLDASTNVILLETLTATIREMSSPMNQIKKMENILTTRAKRPMSEDT
jgi:hypothetical protein